MTDTLRCGVAFSQPVDLAVGVAGALGPDQAIKRDLDRAANCWQRQVILTGSRSPSAILILPSRA